MIESGGKHTPRALGVLRAEHRNLAKVLCYLAAEVERLGTTDRKPRLGLLYSIVYYIRIFPDRVHHPKEDEYLFARMRRRSDEATEVLDELNAEHARFGPMLEAVEQALRHYDAHYPHGLHTLQRTVKEYLDFQWQHMEKEEERVLPVAQRTLTEDDWKAIDNAFSNNSDPLFGENLIIGFELLLERITRQSESHRDSERDR